MSKTGRTRGAIRALIRAIAKKGKPFGPKQVCAINPNISPEQARQNIWQLAQNGEIRLVKPSVRITTPSLYQRTSELREPEFTNKCI